MTLKNDIGRRGFMKATGTAAVGAALGGVTGLMPGIANAQSYPSRSLAWMIWTRAGGSLDVYSRVLAKHLEKQGVPSNMEFVTGAGGRIARTKLYSDKSNGYRLMTDIAIDVCLGEVAFGAAYKALEFEPIGGFNREGYLLSANKGSQLRTLEDVIKASKQRTVTVGDLGRGSSAHLQVIQLNKALGINLNIVHFQGSSKTFTALWGEHIDLAMAGPGSTSRGVDKLHPIAAFKKGGEMALPNAPTAKSQGFDVPSVKQLWMVMMGPNLPADRLNRIVSAWDAAFTDGSLIADLKKAKGVSSLYIPRAEVVQAMKDNYKLALQVKDQMA